MKEGPIMMMLLASLLLAFTVGDTQLVCNLNVLTPAERQEYGARTERLMSSVVKIEDVAHGYRLHFGPGLQVTDLLQWIDAERRCCPFLDFETRLEREGGARWLQMTGPAGVKAFLKEEIGAFREQGSSARGR
jgi:hypothetical protein